MRYVGGNTRCVSMLENIRVGQLWKLLEEATWLVLREQKVWYNIKFDRRLFVRKGSTQTQEGVNCVVRFSQFYREHA